MTIDERFERIEHVTAGLAEQQRKDWEEARQLWRDTQRQLDEAAARINELTLKDAEARERMDRMEAQSRAENKELKERVDALVSAMGEWIRRGGGRPEPNN